MSLTCCCVISATIESVFFVSLTIVQVISLEEIKILKKTGKVLTKATVDDIASWRADERLAAGCTPVSQKTECLDCFSFVGVKLKECC